MNKQHVTVLVLLDVIAAFDTVDHNVLLSRLHSKFGISGTALEWFRSYLNGRSQRVIVQGNLSQSLNLDLYRRALASGHCFSRFMQADCLMLSRCTFPRFTATLSTRSCMSLSVQTKAPGNLRRSLLFSTVWMTNDKLLLNDDKTEFLMIGTKQQLAKVNMII